MCGICCGKKWCGIFSRWLFITGALLFLYTANCGINYYASSFSSYAGLEDGTYTVEELDNLVINEIKKLSVDRASFDSMVERCSDKPSIDCSALQDRISEIEKQITRRLNLYQAGLVNLDDIGPRLSDLREEKEKLQQNLLSLDPATASNVIDTAWENLQSFPSVVESGDLQSVHRLVHSLIDKIVVLNADVTIYWSFC